MLGVSHLWIVSSVDTVFSPDESRGKQAVVMNLEGRI